MSRSSDITLRVLRAVTVSVFIVLAVVNAYQSLGWEVIWDAEIFSYIGWLVRTGLVPYRDIFTVDLPGTLLIYSWVVKFLGPGDLAFRLFDLSFLLVIDILIIVYCKRYGLLAGILAAGLFSCIHLSAGANQAAQRDYLQVLFVLAGFQLCASVFETGRYNSLLFFLSGACIGASLTIKPVTALLFPVIGLIACLYLAAAKRRVMAPLGAFLAGGCMVPLCAGCWLWSHGALAPFLDIVCKYTAVSYAQASLAPFQQVVYLNSYFGCSFLYLAGVLFVLSGIYLVRKKQYRPRFILLCVGVAYGLFHVLCQRKYFFYHYYPLAAFACMLAAVYTVEIKLRANKLLEIIILCTVVFFIAGQGCRSYTAIAANRPWRNKFKDVMQVEIAQNLPPGGALQPLLLNGMHRALQEMGLLPPNRFIYDFPFYHDADHPYIQELRREFIAALNKKPPALILLARACFPCPVYERIEKFPEFSRFLQRYDIVSEHVDYRLYKYRGGAGR